MNLHPSLCRSAPLTIKSGVQSLRFGGQDTGANQQSVYRANSPSLNAEVNSTQYASVLDACTCPRFGKQVHAHSIKNGFHYREFVQTKLLQMYGRCGDLNHVAILFDKMPHRNLYTYTSIFNVLLDYELFEEAYAYLERLLNEQIQLEFFIFPPALKICVGYGGFELGRQINGLASKVGALCHIYVKNALIDMYGKCGRLIDAQMVFDTMPERDCVSWNSMVTALAFNGKVFEGILFMEKMLREKDMIPSLVSWSSLICGFSRKNCDEEAIRTLFRMIELGFEPNARILACVIPSCARLRRGRLGEEIYGYVIRHGFMSSPYVVNGVMDLYRKCGDMESALKVFSRCSVRDEVSYNTMIATYFENGEVSEAERLFNVMRGESKTDLISWNTMISGYVENHMFEEALRMLIILMEEGVEFQPNSFTLGSVLGACADIGCLWRGQAIHSYCIVRGLEGNRFVGGALVDMYCRCRDLDAAAKAIRQIPERDVVIWNSFVSGHASGDTERSIKSVLQQMKEDGFEPDVYTWNSIIAGHMENGWHELALQSLLDMQSSKLRPDAHTVGIILPLCSRLASLALGKQVHGYAIRCGFEYDVYIVAALVDMYAKCGNMSCAQIVHRMTTNHNLVTQNTMLNAYAMHGHGNDGIVFFRKMLADGFKVDNATFLAVLSLCVHTGSVEAGREFFDMMGSLSVEPTVKHFTCMVDLLSRAGRVDEGLEIIEAMTVDADSVIWGALLGGCLIHGNVEIGEMAVEKLLEFEPNRSWKYVMVAKLYGCVGKWDEIGKIREEMKEGESGCSWIEGKNGITHCFMASDGSHPRSKEVYEILDSLIAEMRLGPYLPNSSPFTFKS